MKPKWPVEVGAAVLGDLPAGEVAVEAVHHRQVQRRRQGQEQVVLGGVHQLVDGFVDVAHEGHAGVGNHLHAPGEAPVGHVVLHDLDGVLVADLDAGHLVEGHRVPEAHQSHLAAVVVVEERRLGGLAAAHQRGVGGEFAEEEGLPGAPGGRVR